MVFVTPYPTVKYDPGGKVLNSDPRSGQSLITFWSVCMRHPCFVIQRRKVWERERGVGENRYAERIKEGEEREKGREKLQRVQRGKIRLSYSLFGEPERRRDRKRESRKEKRERGKRERERGEKEKEEKKEKEGKREGNISLFAD
eukprot:1391684-Amorphochlora_amoeboformis.AAC.1